jgi:pilus assembly protein TadC
MPGFELFRWNKWVWGVFFILGLTVFSFVLVPMPSAWSRVNEPFALWVGLFIGYVIVALGVWLFVHLVNRRNARREKETAKSA